MALIPNDLRRALWRPVTFTHIGMMAESITRAFWPLWTVCIMLLGLLAIGVQDRLPNEAVFVGLAVFGTAALAALVWGLRRFRWPSRAEAVARVDATLPGRPIATLNDAQVVGAGDRGSEALWDAHRARIAGAVQGARRVRPDLRVSQADRFGLRYMALVLLSVGVLFGSVLRVGSVADIALPPSGATDGPSWEGWAEPPAYTGRPSLYLNDLDAGPLELPEGTKVHMRFYGEAGSLALRETVSAPVEPSPEDASTSLDPKSVTIAQSGTLAVDGPKGREWDIAMIPDEAPEIELTGMPKVEKGGEYSFQYAARDDFGIRAARAVVTLDPSRVDRRHGLAIEPEPQEELTIQLALPFGNDRAEFEQTVVDTISGHPLANMPVTMVLYAADDLGQEGASEPIETMVPGRRFFQPTAKAIAEQRRDLFWSRENGPRVAKIMRAIGWKPEDTFAKEAHSAIMRSLISDLDELIKTGFEDEEAFQKLTDDMWAFAEELEEGTLADARERLRRAQERLAEAMRNGASEEEIAELMDELRAAKEDYMRMLAEQAEANGEDGTDQPDGGGESQMITQDQIDELINEIERLMQEGKMAEAQALMDQLAELLENLQMTENQNGEGQGGPGEQSMEDLSDTLREQQELSDEAFRQLQDQFNNRQPGQQQQGQQQGDQQGQQGEQGQQGQGNPSGQQGQQDGQGQQGEGEQSGEGDGVGEGGGYDSPDAIAEAQRRLRQELERQRSALPGIPGEDGDAARESLEDAERAMDRAEDSLREGDLPGAIENQADAMNALREGLRSLQEALESRQAGNPDQREGVGRGGGQEASDQPSDQQDPLGRTLSQDGRSLDGGDEMLGEDQSMADRRGRANDLYEELRRRQTERDRSEDERSYLDRLLNRF